MSFLEDSPRTSDVFLLTWLCSPELLLKWGLKITALPCMYILKISEVAQSYPTLCNPMNCSLPGSSIHGMFQARVLEWVAISFSRGSSWPRDSNPGLPHCRQTLYPLSHKGSPILRIDLNKKWLLRKIVKHFTIGKKISLESMKLIDWFEIAIYTSFEF